MKFQQIGSTAERVILPANKVPEKKKQSYAIVATANKPKALTTKAEVTTTTSTRRMRHDKEYHAPPTTKQKLRSKVYVFLCTEHGKNRPQTAAIGPLEHRFHSYALTI